MSRPEILFQYQTTDASTDLTDGSLSFVAPEGGVSMINSVMACASSGGASNFFRIYHCGPDETPAVGNMIIRSGANANAKAMTSAQAPMKIIMNPGDQIFCQLHSGDGITITAYGIVPDSLTQTAMSEMQSDTSTSTSGSTGQIAAYK